MTQHPAEPWPDCWTCGAPAYRVERGGRPRVVAGLPDCRAPGDAPQHSAAERLAAYCRDAGCPPPVFEHVPRDQALASPRARPMPLDLAWPDAMTGVEIDGGGQHGRHARPAGVRRDHAKRNELAALGWRVFLIAPEFVGRGDGAALARLLADVVFGGQQPVAGVTRTGHPHGPAPGYARATFEARRKKPRS